MSTLVDLKSEKGHQLLAEVIEKKGPYQPFLHSIFCKQVGRKNCGIVSAALVLSAGAIGKSKDLPNPLGVIDIEKGNILHTEDNIFSNPDIQKVITQEKIIENGMTLQEVSDILTVAKCQSQAIEASSSSVVEFRSDALLALNQQDSTAAIIINYHMETLGQGTLGGHHSPLVAYHEKEDMFLLLDTWPDTEVCWAKSEDLFRAMNTVDSKTNKGRGYILFETTQ